MSLFELLAIGVLAVATAVVVMLAIVVVRNAPRSACTSTGREGRIAGCSTPCSASMALRSAAAR